MSARSELKRLVEACSEPVTQQVLDLKQFGEVLRYHREDAGIGLREMARHLKLSAPFLSDCEHGKRNLSEVHRIEFIQHIITANRRKRGKR